MKFKTRSVQPLLVVKGHTADVGPCRGSRQQQQDFQKLIAVNSRQIQLAMGGSSADALGEGGLASACCLVGGVVNCGGWEPLGGAVYNWKPQKL